MELEYEVCKKKKKNDCNLNLKYVNRISSEDGK